VALGVLLSRPAFARVRGVIFSLLGLGQTIPSLALLALAVGLLGIGFLPAVVALSLYSILPVARNTAVGIGSADRRTLDAARGLGLTKGQILWSVELPLATPMILAGLRVSTVVAIGAAALAARIGAGGLGEFIFSGIALFRPEVMLVGAIPTALLALAADGVLGYTERAFARRYGS
jgi:osmoprotectant transport system permease protein